MTGLSLYDPEISRREPPSQRFARARMGAAGRGALITGACVLAGFSCVTTLLPDVATPGRVAAAYMTARYERDWPAAWALLCEDLRSRMTFQQFAREASYVNDYYFMPREVDVEAGRPELTPYHGHTYVTVTVRVTSDQGNRDEWVDDGELPLVRETGRFRVCLPEDRARQP